MAITGFSQVIHIIHIFVINLESLDFQGFSGKSALLFFEIVCYNDTVLSFSGTNERILRKRFFSMADITLHRDNELPRTIVPNYFIDAYMVHANGEYVKVYLYLLRCMNDPTMSFSISDAADKFEHTEKDIIRALKYWEKMHLLRLEFNADKELVGICFLDIMGFAPSEPAVTLQMNQAAKAEKAASVEKPDQTIAGKTIPKKKSYNAAELARLSDEEQVKEILFIAETYIGHPLSATEMNSILFWKESLNFSSDLIDYLIESCVSKNHKSIHYMDKVALAWAQAGITEVADAKERDLAHSSLYTTVRKSFGIQGRDFVSFEIDLLKKWKKQYGFSDELIGEACERTIRQTSQPNFSYADSILTNWYQNKVSTLKDVELLDQLHQEKQKGAKRTTSGSEKKAVRFNDFSQRSYDMDELEKELLHYGTHQ